MSDPTLSALVLIGLVFGGIATARITLRAVLILSGMFRELTRPGIEAPLWRPLQAANPA